MPVFGRISLLIAFCCLYASAFSQQSGFSWLDNKTNLNWRIDTSSHILKQEFKPEEWKDAAVVKITNGTLGELPSNFSTNSFLSSDTNKRYFTVIGTGQVYQFTKSACTLVRLDKTYYRGYNFGSCQFMRNDTIYSFGGSGFWRYNSTLTYYDWVHQEWEWFHSKNEGPQVITSHFSGYDEKNDIFYSALNPDNREEYGQRIPSRDSRVFALNLKNKNWSLLGSVDNQGAYNLTEPIVWSGRYFFQCNDNFLLIIDPEENKVLKYYDGKSIFTSIASVTDKTLVVRYGKFNNKYIRESFSIKDILKAAKYIGPFYTDRSAIWQRYCGLGLGITALAGFIGYTFRGKKRNPSALIDSEKNSLSSKEITVLKALVSNADLNAAQLNAILNIESKSYDNQRKIRKQFHN